MFRKTTVFLLLCLLVCLFAAAGAEELTVSVPETVKGYTPCEIEINSPVAGEAELKLLDPMQNVWLTRKETLSEGKNVLPWDGLGEFGERMFAGPYRFLVKITGADGETRTSMCLFAGTDRGVQAFPVEVPAGTCRVDFVFLPGTQFDFYGFSMEEA